MVKNIFFSVAMMFFMVSCSTKSQLLYLKDVDDFSLEQIEKKHLLNVIQPGDILDINVQSTVPEAAASYNKISRNEFSSNNLDIIRLEGYLVNRSYEISYPVLGNVNIKGLDTRGVENKIRNILVSDGHLSEPTVIVKRVNSKFTVLGEVKNPGTFSYFDDNLNIFQALGYAGDLTILAKRNNIKIIRQRDGVRHIKKISLSSKKLLNEPYFQVKNNDVIIVDPNFSKVKSAGFIGSPSSIASIASLLLSITLLIIN